jgi:hypothetical protein
MQKNTKPLKVFSMEDISITDMKKFLAIIIFMDHFKKDKIRHYWGTKN